MQLRRETCFSVTFRHDTGCNKGLLLHSGLCLKRTSKIMQIPYLTPQGGFSCPFGAIHLLYLAKTH